MSAVSPEFLGAARAFRTVHVAEHTRAIAMMDKLATPLMGRHQLRQPPSPTALPRVAQAWREQVPRVGRLGLAAKVTKAGLRIFETRIAPATFRFEGWEDGATETAIVLTQMSLIVSAARFTFDHVPVASMPLHALARRFSRGWDNSAPAVCADLAALASAAEGALEHGGSFSIEAVDGGRWVGTVVQIERRAEPENILVVRSFLSADMKTRAAADEIEQTGADAMIENTVAAI